MHTRKDLNERIIYFRKLGYKDTVKKYENMLKEKIERLKQIKDEKILPLKEAMKLSNVHILFIRGLKYFYLMSKQGDYRYSIKADGKLPPAKLSFVRITLM